MLPEELIDAAKKRLAPYPCEGFVSGTGPLHPEVMFIGEAPGETEFHNGIPFSGRAGREFNLFLDYLDLSREEVYITSAVRSRPYKWGNASGNPNKKYNRTPTLKEAAAHAPVLDYEIQTFQPRVLVPMGKIAYRRLTGDNPKMSSVTGRLQKRSVLELTSPNSYEYQCSAEEHLLFPIYHPAALLYNRSLESSMYEHLRRLRECLKQTAAEGTK